MLSVKDLTVDQCVPIKHANLWIALNALMYVNHLTVSLIAKFQNLNAKLFVLNQFATGSVLNHYVLNLSANWFVKTPLVDHKLSAVNVTNLVKESNK